jgi:hypothetical protein
MAKSNRPKLAAYKVKNADGFYAIGFFSFSRKSTGRTWVSKSALKCSLSLWVRSNGQIPADWVVCALTLEPLAGPTYRVIPASQF